MPNALMHLIIGLMVILSLTYLTHTPSSSFLILTLIITLVSAVLPDIDHEQSKTRRVVGGLAILGLGMIWALQHYASFPIEAHLAPLLILLGGIGFLAVTRPFPHRGPTHSLLALGIYTMLIYLSFRNPWLTLVSAIALYSHIFFDFTTTAFKNIGTERSVVGEFIKIVKVV